MSQYATKSPKSSSNIEAALSLNAIGAAARENPIRHEHFVLVVGASLIGKE